MEDGTAVGRAMGIDEGAWLGVEDGTGVDGTGVGSRDGIGLTVGAGVVHSTPRVFPVVMLMLALPELWNRVAFGISPHKSLLVKSKSVISEFSSPNSEGIDPDKSLSSKRRPSVRAVSSPSSVGMDPEKSFFCNIQY